MEEYKPEPEQNIKAEDSQLSSVVKLMERAMSGKQSDFEFLKSWPERRVAKAWKSGTAKIANGFKKSAERCLHDYIESAKSGKEDPRKLIGYRDLITCYEFYMQEARVAADIMDEYDCYIRHGHILDTLLGVQRREEDLHDFRNSDSFRIF